MVVVIFLVCLSVFGLGYEFVGVIVACLWVWLLGVCWCGCCEFVGVLVSLWVWL